MSDQTIERNLTRLGVYVRTLADRLRLADWRIEIDPELADEGSSASIGCTDGRKVAVMRVGRGCFAEPPEERRHTVVHELLHIHLWGVMVAANSVREPLGTAAYDVFWANLMNAIELAVDGIADGIAPLMPTMEELEEGAGETEPAS